MNNQIKIAGRTFEVLDALNNVTLADSFVKNKTGTGHGEGKLYVGNENERTFQFFDDLNREFFFVKSDFDKYLLDAKAEFENPQQEYVRKETMSEKFVELTERLHGYSEYVLSFKLKRSGVMPPRVYLTSDSEYYDFMRAAGLPNISYLSFLKLKNLKNQSISYYCRIFIDYKSDIVKYESPLEVEAEKAIENNTKMPDERKEQLMKARLGQGEYRRKLLEDCPFCPFTMVNDERLLIASHIKPWVKSDDTEKIDPKNGFALTPTFDKLFDGGFITFTEDKKLLVSPFISPMNQNRLSIHDGLIIRKLPLDEKRWNYLQYHRENVFKGNIEE